MNNSFEYKIKVPCRILIAGPSGCGKSSLIAKLLTRQSEVFDPKPHKKVIYCCKESSSNFVDIPNDINFTVLKEIPSIDELPEDSLLILDDFMEDLSKSSEICSLFIRTSRHRNISVIFLVQNLFYKNIRTISLNATHLVIFKSPRDSSFITHLARQIFPGRHDYLMSAFADATKKPHGYLLINITQDQDESLRLSSSFFAEEALVYIPLRK